MLTATTTSNESKRTAPLLMMLRCPKVGGSNDPGKTALIMSKDNSAVAYSGQRQYEGFWMSLENRRIVSQADFLKNRTSSIPIAGAGNPVHGNHNASHFTWNSIFFRSLSSSVFDSAFDAKYHGHMKEIRTLAILAVTLATLSCQSAKRDFESVGKLSMRNLKHKDDLSVQSPRGQRGTRNPGT